MRISRDTVATVSFTVTDEQGQVVDRTKPDHPVVALIGHGFLVPGLEKALDGHEKGDEFTVTLNPADSYGEFKPELVQEIDKAMFGGFDVKVGNVFEADSNAGPVPVTVKEVKENTVVVDANHPYAGKIMTFLVVVDDVRAATDEEKKHGHAHPDGTCPSDAHSHHCCHHHHNDGEEHECCCDHHHDHDDGGEHECCCGHHHDHDDGEEHECCCGHHHDHDDGDEHECCCGHHHDHKPA